MPSFALGLGIPRKSNVVLMNNNIFISKDCEQAPNIVFDNQNKGSSNNITTQSTIKHAGNNSLKFQWSGSGSAIVEGDISWNMQQTLIYMRKYLYIASPFSLGAINKGIWTFNAYGAQGNGLKVGFYGNGSTTPNQWRLDIIHAGGTATTFSSTNFSLDTWHSVEVKWLKDKTQGGAELSVDGTVVLSDFTRDTNSYDPTMVQIGCGNFVSGTQPINTSFMYIDDIVISSNPIGL